MTPAKAKENVAAIDRGMLPEFPFALRSMRDEMERLFERFAQVWQGNGGWKWGLDVEDHDEVVIRAEAPGFEPGDFDLQVRGQEVVLKASKKTESKDKDGKVREVRQQECFQSVTIPAGIDKEKVAARYSNGILTVTLPRTADGKGKRIPVTGA